MSIHVENISKQFGEQWAVKNISFSVRSGEIAGFIGPNGAGKSTTMRMITGYLPPSSGEVLVGGLSHKTSGKEIKRLIGYLPENNPLYPEMYVREYLAYTAGLYGIRGVRANKRIDEIIQQTGLSEEQHKRIGKLSKGYRQRVGLGQALIHDPQILILDEPTSGLDPNQIIEIRSLISTIGKQKTVLLSTHIMQEVEAICHKVIIIDKGEIKADETAGMLKSKSLSGLTIELELESEFPQEEWLKIPGITDVRKISGSRYLLAAKSGQDIRSLLFKFAVAHGLTILSMTRRESSLEEVFRDLTGKNEK